MCVSLYVCCECVACGARASFSFSPAPRQLREETDFCLAPGSQSSWQRRSPPAGQGTRSWALALTPGPSSGGAPPLSLQPLPSAALGFRGPSAL